MPGPWRAGNKFDRGERAPGTLGPSTAHTMVGVDRLRNLHDLAQRALDDNIPGDFIETGVWRGGCCILMRGILAANGVRERKVYVADSFKGVPPPRPELYPADRGDTLYTHSELAVPLDTVKANFDRYGLLDDQVVFVEGLFSDTLPSLRCGSFALIRLDGDLYESTTVALQHLHPKLAPGGFVIIDDFGGWSLFQELLMVLAGIAARHGADIASVATRAILDRSAIAAAIVGATNTTHIQAHAQIGALRLEDADRAAIASVTDRRRGPLGDVYLLERDRTGRHGQIMKYELNALPIADARP